MQRVLFLTTAVLMAPLAAADEPPKGRSIQVVSPKANGINATGINDLGDIIGFEWAENKNYPGVLDQVPFFARGKEITPLPLLRGYTATFPAAVDENGRVVGRVSRPPSKVSKVMRNQAFLWDAKSGIQGLGALEGDVASFACGITRDGKTISGYSVGDRRIRACVWEKRGERWEATVLPHATRLGSQVVPISDDGRFVAATDGAIPCLWTRGESNGWTREAIGEAGALIPRAVNNRGTVVGIRYPDDGNTQAVIWTRDKGCKRLRPPADYGKSEATDVNNDDVVVGMLDGPNVSDKGPRAFLYENGRLRLIEEGGPTFVAANAINDRGQVAGVMEDEEDEEKPAAPDAKTPAPPAKP